MKTLIYAAYLTGSQSPDYIGSHFDEPRKSSPSLRWRYENAKYLGQGTWIHAQTGEMVSAPRLNTKTKWGNLLLNMIPQQRKEIRIEILDSVEVAQRNAAESAAIRQYQPPYNVCLKSTPPQRREKFNAYYRSYLPKYYAAHPDKLEAKRAADRKRIADQRSAAKAKST